MIHFECQNFRQRQQGLVVAPHSKDKRRGRFVCISASASASAPAWKPPDWAFGPIWTTIFACAAVAGINAWRRAPDRASRDGLLIGFAFKGLFNALWSVLYFRLRRPDGSHAEVALLWANRPFGG